ncbi:IS66 family transposase [Planctomicrobium sp. SH661]|uniref:IS66 family transposase n=1 Tax=Planctomicrobium sp. SH661 TaxID=3448124 RepID=UPI003F5C9F8E
MAHFRQSKRRAALFISSVLNIPCSPSLTVKHQAVATLALRKTYDELVAALPSQSHLHGDESPTKQGIQKSWLWTFVAKNFTLFALRNSRAADLKCDRAFQRATVISTHRAPSKYSREERHGRPPRRSTRGPGNRSAIKSHVHQRERDLGPSWPLSSSENGVSATKAG